MSPNRSDMRLTGADVLCDGEMQRRPLAIRDGVIAKGNLPEVDLTGYLVLPGIVDMHGDAFERHIAPRPNASFPLKSALAATDRDAAANGVTTAWLAQSWSWEGGRRSPDFAENLLEAVAACRPALQTDMRVQLRCETHTVDTAQRLLGTIEHHGVDYVVFNNHLEDALHMAANRPEELAFWAKGAGRTVEGYMEIVQEARKLSKSVPRFLCRLAESFDRLPMPKRARPFR